MKGALNAWPIIVTIAVYVVLRLSLGTGNHYLDVGTWPSAFSCKNATENCNDTLAFDRTIRMLEVCAAILPFLNYVGHSIALAKIYRRIEDKELERVKNFINLSMIIMAVVLVFNGMWILLIRYQAFSADTDDQDRITLVMFVALSVVDILTVLAVNKDKTEEARLERGYFLGSLCFIDIPTLFGILAVIFIVGPSIASKFGETRFPIAQALYGGSTTMHIAVSQIAFVFLALLRAPVFGSAPVLTGNEAEHAAVGEPSAEGLKP